MAINVDGIRFAAGQYVGSNETAHSDMERAVGEAEVYVSSYLQWLRRNAGRSQEEEIRDKFNKALNILLEISAEM